MQTPEGGWYCKPADFLEQGDVFGLDVVAPFADFTQRLFRTEDGRHGSAVFEEGVPATVFSRTELENTLRISTRTRLHTAPFGVTEDDQCEMVVVHAMLVRYFVIASQTCDVSGIDAEPLSHVLVVPIRTLVETCQSERLPFYAGDPGSPFVGQTHPTEDLTIHEYLVDRCKKDELLKHTAPADYGAALRLVVEDWMPTKGTTEKQNAGLIKSFINNQFKLGHVDYLPDAPKFDVPEGIVDFSMIFTASRQLLVAQKEKRLARIADPYRDAFSRRLADQISRIATPRPKKPDKL